MGFESLLSYICDLCALCGEPEGLSGTSRYMIADNALNQFAKLRKQSLDFWGRADRDA
jgi:hypothetical protein